MRFDQRAAKIELILSDVDGVLTDGGIAYDNQGIEYKQFHVRMVWESRSGSASVGRLDC